MDITLFLNNYFSLTSPKTKDNECSNYNFFHKQPPPVDLVIAVHSEDIYNYEK
jgi:hypothetical protein